jgi:hypothetical protein
MPSRKRIHIGCWSRGSPSPQIADRWGLADQRYASVPARPQPLHERKECAQPLIALIAFESRDLVLATALAWITLLVAARSSFFTSVA